MFSWDEWKARLDRRAWQLFFSDPYRQESVRSYQFTRDLTLQDAMQLVLKKYRTSYDIAFADAVRESYDASLKRRTDSGSTYEQAVNDVEAVYRTGPYLHLIRSSLDLSRNAIARLVEHPLEEDTLPPLSTPDHFTANRLPAKPDEKRCLNCGTAARPTGMSSEHLAPDGAYAGTPYWFCSEPDSKLSALS